jgi:predicted metal-dependent hydrolase
VEAHLRALSEKELVPRTLELAAQHGLALGRVVVRSQRSRWGSCSVRGTISLNWRLIQAPFWVRDYLIVHELMHLRQMNHSSRFWALVRAACPEYEGAEAWLNAHAQLLR